MINKRTNNIYEQFDGQKNIKHNNVCARVFFVLSLKQLNVENVLQECGKREILNQKPPDFLNFCFLLFNNCVSKQ